MHLIKSFFQIYYRMSLLSEVGYQAYTNNFAVRNESLVDKLPQEMHYMIHAHWYRFPPLNPLWQSLLGLAMVVAGIISLIGNGVVMYIFSTTKSLRTPSNLLVVNLALSDFLMMLTQMPTMTTNCFAGTWILGPFMCELYGMWGSIFGCGSIWSMVMIAVDRYNVIVKGLAAPPLTHKKAAGMCFFVWAWSLIWTLLPFFGWSRQGKLDVIWMFKVTTMQSNTRAILII